MVVEPASVRSFTFSKIFFSETAWPIKVKFYVEHPWVGGTKVCVFMSPPDRVGIPIVFPSASVCHK